MRNNDMDYTDKFGPPGGLSEWPMYSYSRPAYNFWNGFANGLRQRGLTDEQIKEELQSKGVRWMLDLHDEKLEALGRKLAKSYELCVTPTAAENSLDGTTKN